MAIGEQKLRLLNVFQMLYERTDEEHHLNATQLLELLENKGLKGERKTIYNDIDTLKEFGVDVIRVNGNNSGYYIGKRTFELEELKLLVGAVQAFEFISEKKAGELIKKLERFASLYQVKRVMEESQGVFTAANILLPKEGIDYEKWAVIACDQYTGELGYWEETKAIVGDAPSTLKFIYPEVYLGQRDNLIDSLKSTMKSYVENKTLEEKVANGFVLVSRVTQSGNRLGLVGKIDLEEYEYTKDTSKPVRATEGTVESRIPPRMKVRGGALIESPHIMLLIDDLNESLIEPLYEKREELKLLYDTELMQGGGHIRGYGVTGKYASDTEKMAAKLEKEAKGLFLAVGDGNHSLATAKACWEELKKSHSGEEIYNHPSRYALVELVNLHSPALQFEPIHRVVFNYPMKDLVKDLENYLEKEDMSLIKGKEITIISDKKECTFEVKGRGDKLSLDIIQNFLDEQLKKRTQSKIDYIHGGEVVRELVKQEGNTGLLFKGIGKDGFFDAIKAGGALPRKTFSMGEANEKRYYMECRNIERMEKIWL